MICILVVLWLVAGMAGVHIGNATDRAKGIPNDPVSVWFVLCGAVILLVTIGIAVEAATEAE